MSSPQPPRTATRVAAWAARVSSVGLLLAVSFLTACSEGDGLGPDGPPDRSLGTCDLNQSGLHDTGLARDAIPALSDPDLVLRDNPRADYLLSRDRVVGIVVEGQAIAIPHNILWWHEIVNFNSLETPLAVTYCPLTGSSLVFDRSKAQGAELGVSGLLLNNNLVIYDMTPVGANASYWPQMLGQAKCGPLDGTTLDRYPSVEMRWDAWEARHPETLVISRETRHNRDYTLYPYGDYETLNNGETIHNQGAHDQRRQPKERVLGIPGANGGGIAFPFLALQSLGFRSVVHEIANGEPIVVFWEGNAESAVAYWPRVDGNPLTFQIRDGTYTDTGTNSEWSFEGVGLSGPMEGKRLTQVPQAYVAFWFAWAKFFPDALLWEE